MNRLLFSIHLLIAAAVLICASLGAHKLLAQSPEMAPIAYATFFSVLFFATMIGRIGWAYHWARKGSERHRKLLRRWANET